MQINKQVKEDKDKYALLFHYVGQQTRNILKKLEDNGCADEDYNKAKAALEGHFKPKMNRVYLMHVLHQCRQGSSETMDTFYMRVRECMAPLELEKLTVQELTELITLSQLVNNTSNNGLRKKALKDGLSLKDFITNARSYERAEMQSKEFEKSELSVHTVRTTQSRRHSDGSKGSTKTCYICKGPYPHKDPCQPRNKGNRECYFCGGEYPHRGECPAREHRCKRCNRKGHYEKKCKVMNVNEVAKEDNSDEEYRVPFVVCSINEKARRDTILKVNEKSVQCVIDTGAEVNVMSESTSNMLKLKINTEKKKKLFGYGRKSLPVIGSVTAKMKSPVTRKSKILEFQVVSGDSETLLGCTTSEELGLVKFTENIKTTAQVSQVQTDLLQEYKQVFSGIGKMKDTQVNLHINKEIRPVQQKQRRIPFHLRSDVEKELERLEDLDIIERAEGPTTWISPIVVVPKAKGVRICLDSRVINTAIERECEVIPTINDLKKDLNGSTVFWTIDLNKGYHQLELHVESRPITTFTTHKGLFRYKRLCFGVNSAAEIFQRKIADMLQGIEGVKNMSDDIIIFAKSEAEHDEILRKVLKCMEVNNVTANAEKSKFKQKSVTYFGHIFSGKGIRPTPEKVAAMVNADAPKNASEVRSLLGMAQYVSHFVANFSSIVAPLRQLTHQNERFRWKAKEKESFENLKQVIAEAQATEYFDVNLQTELIVDASPIGLGAILTQREPEGRVRIIEYASRGLTEAEKNYSQIEREMLAIVWGCEHFDLYLYGSTFKVLTDHNPLLDVMKPTATTTARLHRLSLRLQPYKMKLEYKAGIENEADYLSRHPQPCENPQHRSRVDNQINFVCVHAVEEYAEEGLTLEMIREETNKDEELQTVISMIACGREWIKAQQFWPYKLIRDELSVANGIVLRGDRIVMPKKLQKKIINIAHSSHQGIVKTKALLRETVWFPGIDKQVETAVRECIPCQASTRSKSPHAPLKMTPLAEGPWEEVSADFHQIFTTGEYLLVVVDDYSRYPEVEIIHSLSAKTVIPKFDAIFARHGVPKVVKTDNGPPFNGDFFTRWGKSIGFHHRKVTPLWPQSNGEAERMMDTLGKLIRISHQEKISWKQKMYQFLRHYRATPHSTTGLSPAEMLFSRKIRTDIPTLKKTVKFHDSVTKAEQKDQRMKEYMKEMVKSKEPEIKISDKVLVKHRPKNKEEPFFNPEPYRVTKMNGTMITAENSNHEITRNVSHFKKIPDTCMMKEGDNEIDLEVSDNEMELEVSQEELQETIGEQEESITYEQPRRSERQRKKPAYLQDYETKF